MILAMRAHSPVRRLLALAAAYVVALQLVLLPLSVAAGPLRSGPLCSELADPAKASPERSAIGCACASGCGMQCCASAFGGPPSFATSIDRTSFAVLTPMEMAAIPGLMSWRSPQNPRAPPRPAA